MQANRATSSALTSRAAEPTLGLSLSGVVAVLGCCTVTARTVQGMARVRSGQAPAWPLSSDRSARRDSGVKHDFACTFITRQFPPPLVVRRSQVMLEAGGAGTYTQRAIPGSEPSQDSCIYLPLGAKTRKWHEVF